MRKFGLIGFPLTHSFSKKHFEEKFKREQIADCSYDLFELKNIEELPSLIKSNPDLVGLNVTIPYKESAIPFLDFTANEAKQIGAVNCIKIIDGLLAGYNTDVFGFEISLIKILPVQQVHAFVLGTGGSSKAVQYVFKKLQIPFTVVSRNPDENSITYFDMANHMKERNLIINTTPLGMYPDEKHCPDIPYELLTPNDILFDLIYNPSETLFLKLGRDWGCKTKNGLEMLQLQAEKSWEIWNS